MSKKLTGNGLWESSRMMLPEHKDRINQDITKQSLVSKPIIHDDEMCVIVDNLTSSYYEKQEVEVLFYRDGVTRKVRGIVSQVANGNKVMLSSNEGSEWIRFDEITGVVF